MEIIPNLVRSPGERDLPLHLLRPLERSSHRPKERFILTLTSSTDVADARSAGLAVFLMTDDLVTMLGYPMSFPSFLVVSTEVVRVLETSFPRVIFRRAEACLAPRLEDLITALLARDAIAARALVERNLDLIDTPYLAKRIHQEDLEEIATSVRMSDRIPMPPVGPEPDKDIIDRLAKANRPQGIIP